MIGLDRKQLCSELEQMVRETVDRRESIQDEQMEAAIDSAILTKSRQEYIPLREKLLLREQVFHSVRGYDCLEELLQREDVTEIMVNGYQTVFIERAGRIERWERGFTSEERYMDVIQQIVAGCNRIVNESSPIVDARLEDGSRVNVVLPPIALDGAVLTIRRFPKKTYGMKDLIAMGMLSQELAEILRLLVQSKYNIMISGGTGSGKTTFLNALSNYIPKEERIITIEDSAELQICGIPNLVRLEVRNANVEGQNAIRMKDLIRSSLRMRPTRIVVGEVRGEEAIDMLQAMNTGHSGSLSTGHANSAKDILYRLETMVLTGMEIPLLAIRQQIASAVDIIVHIGRLRDGSRRVLEITEVDRLQDGEILLHPLYGYDSVGETEGGKDLEAGEEKGEYQWKKMGVIIHEEKLKQSGCLEFYRDISGNGSGSSNFNRNPGMYGTGIPVL